MMLLMSASDGMPDVILDQDCPRLVDFRIKPFEWFLLEE